MNSQLGKKALIVVAVIVGGLLLFIGAWEWRWRRQSVEERERIKLREINEALEEIHERAPELAH